MKQLKRINLIQYYLFDKEQIDIEGSTVILGANGSGKSTLLDAIQLVMNGGHKMYQRFNAQSSQMKSTRTARGYCLGMLRGENTESDIRGMARETAQSYITLGFADETGWCMTAGISISASK